MARLGLDATGFEKNMAKADSQVNRFGKQTLGALKGQLAAAFSFGAIAAGINNAVESASRLNDQTAKLGVGTKFFQEWAFGAKQAGSSSEELAGFLEKLAVARTKALGGGASENKAFEQFGVSVKDLQSGSLEDIAAKVSKAFESGNPQEFIASLRVIGGRGAGGLIPAFADGMDDAAKQAQELGLVISDDTIQSLDALGDRFDIIKAQFNVGFSQIGTYAVKAWSAAFNAAEKYFQAAIQFGVGFRQGNGIKDSINRAVASSLTAVEETGITQDSEEAALKMLQEKKRKSRLSAPDFSGVKSAVNKAVEASQFQSSADKSVASLGGYYLGGDATAGMDLARQALELAKRTADDTKRSADRLDAIDAKLTSLE
jgi:hypothetical protein